MTFYSSIATPPPISRAALLVGLENIAYTSGGELLGANALGARLDEVLALDGSVQYRLVAAQHHLLVCYGDEVPARNLRWQECLSGPDEADRALTQAGLGRLLRGFERIVVASRDHFSARFGDLCDLCVAAPRGVSVSARLASAGTVVDAARGASVRATRTVATSATQPGTPVAAAD